MASDDFNRASSADLGTNWTPQQAGVNGGLACRIINNVEATWDSIGDVSAEVWNVETFNVNHYAEITLAAPLETSTAQINYGSQAIVRMSAIGALEKYLVAARTGQLSIVKMPSTGPADISLVGSTFAGTISVGDVIRLEAENSGSDVLLRAYQNGVLRISATDVAPGAPFTTNIRVGIGGVISNDTSAVTTWAADNLTAPVTPSKGRYWTLLLKSRK